MILLNLNKKIKGDSVYKGYEDWISVHSVNFSITRGISGVSGGADRKVDSPIISDIPISKKLDVASVFLMIQAASGISLGKVEIHFVEVRDGAVTPYLEIELTEGILGGYSLGGSGNGEEAESFFINHIGLKMKYNQLKDGKIVAAGQWQGIDMKTSENVSK